MNEAGGQHAAGRIAQAGIAFIEGDAALRQGDDGLEIEIDPVGAERVAHRVDIGRTAACGRTGPGAGANLARTADPADQVFEHFHLVHQRIVALDRFGAQLVGDRIDPLLGRLELLGERQVGGLEIVDFLFQRAALLRARRCGMGHAGDDEHDRAHHPGGHARHQAEPLETDRGHGRDGDGGHEDKNIERAGHAGLPMQRIVTNA